MKHFLISTAMVMGLAPAAMAEDITVGFAIAKSGWMEAHDTPATTAARVMLQGWGALPDYAERMRAQVCPKL